MKLSQYPSYVPTSAAWLPEAPAHWTSSRLRHLALLNPSKTESVHAIRGDELVTFLPMEAVSSTGEIRSTEQRPVSELATGFTYFRRGDVLLAKITPCFENGKGAYLGGLPTEIGFGSTEFIVIRARRELDPRFLYLLTTTPQFRQAGKDAMTGAAGQQRVPVDFVRDFIVPLPPPEEQDLIVRFINHQDRKFANLLRNKRRLIALLTEQKQAIIHRAVTRGLDPDAPRKPSGVAWLGEVPAHWDEVSVGSIAQSLQTGPFGTQLHAMDYVAGGTPVINPSHLREGVITPNTEVAVDDETVRRLSQHQLELGDIVLARRGELGRCALVGPKDVGYLCGTGSLRLRPRACVFDPNYLLRVLSSSGVRDVLQLSSVGSTMDNLNTGIIARVRLPKPPLEEQGWIVSYIRSEASKLDLVIERAQREIALFREYRTRLIADVVTGKVDVRHLAADLPESTAADAPSLAAADDALNRDSEFDDDLDHVEEVDE